MLILYFVLVLVSADQFHVACTLPTNFATTCRSLRVTIDTIIVFCIIQPCQLLICIQQSELFVQVIVICVHCLCKSLSRNLFKFELDALVNKLCFIQIALMSITRSNFSFSKFHIVILSTFSVICRTNCCR